MGQFYPASKKSTDPIGDLSSKLQDETRVTLGGISFLKTEVPTINMSIIYTPSPYGVLMNATTISNGFGYPGSVVGALPAPEHVGGVQATVNLELGLTEKSLIISGGNNNAPGDVYLISSRNVEDNNGQPAIVRALGVDDSGEIIHWELMGGGNKFINEDILITHIPDLQKTIANDEAALLNEPLEPILPTISFVPDQFQISNVVLSNGGTGYMVWDRNSLDIERQVSVVGGGSGVGFVCLVDLYDRYQEGEIIFNDNQFNLDRNRIYNDDDMWLDEAEFTDFYYADTIRYPAVKTHDPIFAEILSVDNQTVSHSQAVSDCSENKIDNGKCNCGEQVVNMSQECKGLCYQCCGEIMVGCPPEKPEEENVFDEHLPLTPIFDEILSVDNQIVSHIQEVCDCQDVWADMTEVCQVFCCTGDLRNTTIGCPPEEENIFDEAPALTPIFQNTISNATGFTVQIKNYDPKYRWSGSATASGEVSFNRTGLVTVTGVAANTSSTATIKTNKLKTDEGIATVTATSSPAGVPATPPDRPKNLVAVPGDTQLVLTWTAPTNTGGAAITDYQAVYAIVSNDGSISNFTTFAGPVSNATSLTITNLENGTKYITQVRAKNSAGLGLISSASSPEIPMGPALIPEFKKPNVTSAGFTAKITNYDPTYSWSGSLTSGTGSVVVSGARKTGLVTVTGVPAGTSATATITTTKEGVIPGSGTVTNEVTNTATGNCDAPNKIPKDETGISAKVVVGTMCGTGAAASAALFVYLVNKLYKQAKLDKSQMLQDAADAVLEAEKLEAATAATRLEFAKYLPRNVWGEGFKTFRIERFDKLRMESIEASQAYFSIRFNPTVHLDVRTAAYEKARALSIKYNNSVEKLGAKIRRNVFQYLDHFIHDSYKLAQVPESGRTRTAVNIILQPIKTGACVAYDWVVDPQGLLAEMRKSAEKTLLAYLEAEKVKARVHPTSLASFTTKFADGVKNSLEDYLPPAKICEIDVPNLPKVPKIPDSPIDLTGLKFNVPKAIPKCGIWKRWLPYLGLVLGPIIVYQKTMAAETAEDKIDAFFGGTINELARNIPDTISAANEKSRVGSDLYNTMKKFYSISRAAAENAVWGYITKEELIKIVEDAALNVTQVEFAYTQAGLYGGMSSQRDWTGNQQAFINNLLNELTPLIESSQRYKEAKAQAERLNKVLVGWQKELAARARWNDYECPSDPCDPASVQAALEIQKARIKELNEGLGIASGSVDLWVRTGVVSIGGLFEEDKDGVFGPIAPLQDSFDTAVGDIMDSMINLNDPEDNTPCCDDTKICRKKWYCKSDGGECYCTQDGLESCSDTLYDSRFECVAACLDQCGTSWNCVSGVCIPVSGIHGTYSTEQACGSGCGTSWNCVGGVCIPVSGINGTYLTEEACESSCEGTGNYCLSTTEWRVIESNNNVDVLQGTISQSGGYQYMDGLPNPWTVPHYNTALPITLNMSLEVKCSDEWKTLHSWVAEVDTCAVGSAGRYPEYTFTSYASPAPCDYLKDGTTDETISPPVVCPTIVPGE